MGFYGNITNTSRTSFSFDKIYSNRYDMDTSRGSDGVYVGRYVLVEYDSKQSKDAYPAYYYYNENMYGAVNTLELIKNNNELIHFISSPQIATLITDTDPGTIVRVPQEQLVANINKKSIFIQITKNEDGSFSYNGIDLGAYNKYLDENYLLVNVAEEEYQPGIYFKKVKDEDPTSDTFNEYIFIFDNKYYQSSVSTESQYLAKTGANVKPENALWVYITTDKYGKEVNQYASLGLNGYYDSKTTWRKWWTDHFGKAIFSLSAFDEYFELTKFDENANYCVALKDNFFEVDLNELEWEPNAYYIKDSNDQFILDENKEFDSKTRYYDRGIYNNDIFINNEQLCYSSGTSFQEGECYRIKASHMYTTNSDYERFFIYNADKTWTELTFTTDSVYFNSKGDTTYLTNFAIDVAAYGTSRGYDSTVWQKVYTEGTEAYVMIAELNSVVPTFDLSADAPTMSPLTPHFDEDTTNVYYKLHWQPSWGLRTKSASNALLGPQIQQDGTVGSISLENLTTDDKCYPSDVDTEWRGDFYDTIKNEKSTKYYSTITANWDGSQGDDDIKIPAAIYFNKDGFDSENIAYSSDLLDKDNEDRYDESVALNGWTNNDIIQVQPTGKSGHLYNTHSKTIDQMAQEDTQEISVMLPSLGDTIAQIWDLVFGGRETNSNIAETNIRNTDIAWESAHASLNRHGLRLVNSDNRDKQLDGFSTAEVNTIAGAINSAHDIMGMIITDGTKASLEARLDNLDEGRIYYDKTDNKYYRKHLTYDYEPKTNDSETFTYTDVTTQINIDNFDPDLLFILVDGKYVRVDKDAVYDENQTYYYRTGSILEERQLTAFNSNKLYYMDYTGSDFDLDPSQNMEMMDYIKDPKYHRGFTYYTLDESYITPYVLSAGYRPGRFFYKVENDYYIDFNKGATDERQYYTISRDKVVDIADYGYNGIYVPGVYYYYDTEENAWKLDQSYTVTSNRVYYRPYATEITPGENEGEEKIYRKEIDYQEVVPIDQHTFEKDMRQGKYYYKFENPSLNISLYTLYTGTWAQYVAEQPTLYVATVKYVLTTETNYEIDESSPFLLANFDTTAYFFEILSEDGKLLGYHPITDIEEIDPDDASLRYKAFICGWDKNQNMYYDWCTDRTSPFAVPQALRPDIEDPTSQIYSQYACHKMNLDTFYLPNKYHYKDNNGSYILDTYPTMTHNVYYTIDPAGIKAIDSNTEFYEPYRYYKWNDQSLDYELVRKDLTQEEINAQPLYWKNELYVYEDKLDKYPLGTVWNPYALDEPDTVTLATRKERYELKEIPEFARNLNTMHGLLLKLNQYMEYDDTYTRDERIANGLMNQLRDILESFDKIIPKRFMTVDAYGRITSTDWDTSQKDTSKLLKTNPLLKDIKGDTFEKVESVDDMKKQWITINLDGDVVKPTLTVRHNFQPVQDSELITDMNEVEDKNSDEANKINIINPKIDDMGHSVGKENNILTLPFGFKTITIAEKSNPEEVIEESYENINAKNTQDTLVLQSINKWINISTNSEDNKILLSHFSDIINVDENEVDFNDEVNEDFTVQIVSYDEAGHIIQENDTKYLLPYNFKTLNVKNTGSTNTAFMPGQDNTLTATNAKDIFTLETGNRWLNVNAYPENNSFVLSHAAAGEASEERTKGIKTDQNPNFGDSFNVPTIGIDEAGHVSLLSENSVTLPLPSLIKGEGNVVTAIELDPKTCKLTETKANIGTLKITGYELGDSINIINENDTINSAFGKLQLQIQSLTSDDISVSDEYKDTVGETVSDAIAHFIKFGGIALEKNDKNGAVEEITIEPNYTVVLANKVEGLDINFVETIDYYARYSVVFTTAKAGCNLSIPNTYTWDGDEPPTLDANKKYILVTDNVTNIVTISKGVAVE